MLVGVPGSGKSTWARDFVMVYPRYRIVSTDSIRATLYGNETIQGEWRQVWYQVLAQWHESIAAIQRGELDGVIYDATNARRRNRREAIAVARQIGFAPIVLGWFDVPLSLALERNRERPRQVPIDIVATMHRQLQGAPPSVAEGVDQVLILQPSSYPKSLFSSSDPLR
ncbi:AAA family ATPase [filamentous cyanobacterium CCT1]|nr:AAA family ATPase [filamentous cyanobacterium CCT1]PSN80725.1 AAA family ATPase [filamentous cyanobacterium CCP4]